MRKATFAVFAVAAVVFGLVFLPPAPAHAAEDFIGSQNDGGNLTRCWLPPIVAGQPLRNLTFQCPGQSVWARSGAGSFVDAGPGSSAYVDFSGGQDTYPWPLSKSKNQDRVCLRAADAGVLDCNFFNVVTE